LNYLPKTQKSKKENLKISIAMSNAERVLDFWSQMPCWPPLPSAPQKATLFTALTPKTALIKKVHQWRERERERHSGVGRMGAPGKPRVAASLQRPIF